MDDVLTDDRADRLQLGRQLMKMIRTKEGREGLNMAGHRPGQDLFSALESDSINHVFGRIIAAAPRPPAVLVIYWPRQDKLAVLSIVPATAPASGAQDPHDIAPGSSVGTLGDYLLMKAEPQVTFRITEWASATASNPAKAVC